MRAHGRAGASAFSSSFLHKKPPPRPQSGRPSRRAKRKGVWGKEFLPACSLPRSGTRGGKRLV
ncbi:hypothetical protein, partial [Desulfovulcanus sp.]